MNNKSTTILALALTAALAAPVAMAQETRQQTQTPPTTQQHNAAHQATQHQATQHQNAQHQAQKNAAGNHQATTHQATPQRPMNQANRTAEQREATRTAANDGMNRPDAWVGTKVKAKFAASSSVAASDINVDVQDGKAVLTGTVETAAARQEAQRLASETEGVTSVDISGLRVQSATTTR